MNAFVTSTGFWPRKNARFSSLLAVAIAHIVAIYLFALTPAREVIQNASAMMVTLIHEQPHVEQKRVELPKQKPIKLQPVAVAIVPSPLIAATNAPADISATLLTPPTPAVVVLTAVTPPSVVMPPRFDADYLDNPAPVYPALSRRIGEEGKVMLRVFVDASGAPNRLEIKSTSGSQRLDVAAIEAVRRWKFAPAKLGEKFIDAWVLVPINFSLRSSG